MEACHIDGVAYAFPGSLLPVLVTFLFMYFFRPPYELAISNTSILADSISDMWVHVEERVKLQ